MKRITSAILAAIMVMLVLSGCQKKVEKEVNVQYAKYSDTFFDAFDL